MVWKSGAVGHNTISDAHRWCEEGCCPCSAPRKPVISCLCTTVFVKCRNVNEYQLAKTMTSQFGWMWKAVNLKSERGKSWSSDFSCFGSRRSFRPPTNGISIDRTTSINIAKTLADVYLWYSPCNKEFCHSIFVLHIIDGLQRKTLL